MRFSTSNPQARKSRMRSPWEMWNSTPGSSGHSRRCMPNCGRCNRSPVGELSSCTQSTINTEFPRNARRPPGRNTLAASGSHRYGSHQMAAPYSEIAKSKLSSANGNLSASP